MFATMTYDAHESFNPMVVAGVPFKPEHFKKVFDEDGVQDFVMFEIVNSREESLFEFTSMGKGYAYADKVDDIDPMLNTSSPQRKAKVAAMAAFYATQPAFFAKQDEEQDIDSGDSYFDPPFEV